jgi:hypothetical protein
MKKVKSKQVAEFVFCKDPMTIDKRASWGDSPDNFRRAPNGAFLKLSGDKVANLVQPNEDFSAPVGWIHVEGRNFAKEDIWVEEIEEGVTEVTLKTLDGPITYTISEPSVICYNGQDEPNLKDCWIQTISNLKKNYEYE